MARIYMDANATTPLLPEVRVVMEEVAAETFGNPSSVHAEGRAAREVVERARAQVAAAAGARPAEIVFTSGATEANIAALRSASRLGEARGRGHMVVSAVEHPSVIETARALALERGLELSVVEPDEHGRVDPDAMLAAVREDTALVAWMLANNEIGNLYPVAEIAEPLRSRGVHLHVDCVQALGKVPVDLSAIGADSASLSAHKAHGPKGVGALWLRSGAHFAPLMTGGHQERERRAGTEAVALAAGFGAASAAAARDLPAVSGDLRRLRDQLWRGIRGAVAGAHLNGDPNPLGRAPNTLNLSFEETEGETVLISLDLVGVSVSSGSACTAGSSEPSHVLSAMGLSPARARAAVRFSLHRGNTAAEVERVVSALPEIVETVRAAAPPPPEGERGV